MNRIENVPGAGSAIGTTKLHGCPAGSMAGAGWAESTSGLGEETLVEAAANAGQDPGWQEFLQKSGLASWFLAGRELDSFIQQEVDTIGGLLRAVGLLK